MYFQNERYCLYAFVWLPHRPSIEPEGFEQRHEDDQDDASAVADVVERPDLLVLGCHRIVVF